MREVKHHKCSGINEGIKIECDDSTHKPYKYDILLYGHSTWAKWGRIIFHEGELDSAGPQGITEEAMIAILIDRLECSFNPSRPQAIIKLQEALFWLQHGRKSY